METASDFVTSSTKWLIQKPGCCGLKIESEVMRGNSECEPYSIGSAGI